jgi:inward rectifier potassium channel
LATPAPPSLRRIINRDGSINIAQVGLRRRPMTDVYHRLLVRSWPRFLGLLIGLYLLSNALFALLYWLDPGGIENARPGSYPDAFYFSIQTMATIGYGKFAPADTYTHLLVTIESVAGLLWTAITTGLIFAKFARPTARVLFSRVATIGLRDGIPSLVFRLANERANHVVEAQLRLTLFRTERTLEGERVRRYHDLALVRNFSPMFTMTWTAVHQITPSSLLYGQTKESLLAGEVEILATFIGLDNTFAQNVHARHSYSITDLRWHERLKDLFQTDSHGRRFANFHHFHETYPVDDQGRPVDQPLAPSDGPPLGHPVAAVAAEDVATTPEAAAVPPSLPAAPG